MARLLLILLLFSLSAHAQSGRYYIETVNSEIREGTVTISPYSIIIDQDSAKLTLPVTDVGEDRKSTYYILSGCHNGRSFQGYGILTENYSERRGNGERFYSTLFIELRAKQAYSATRYSIYYER